MAGGAAARDELRKAVLMGPGVRRDDAGGRTAPEISSAFCAARRLRERPALIQIKAGARPPPTIRLPAHASRRL
jgi:hypothetical protein